MGDLQRNLSKYDERGVTVVALSVDKPDVTLPWATEKGLSFPLLSDPDLKIIRGWNLENEGVGDLAWHAVYLIDTDGTIFYRKVARRRAYSKEFLAAIDYWQWFKGSAPAAPSPSASDASDASEASEAAPVSPSEPSEPLEPSETSETSPSPPA